MIREENSSPQRLRENEDEIQSPNKAQKEQVNFNNDLNPVRISRQFCSRGALEEREETRRKVSLGEDF